MKKVEIETIDELNQYLKTSGHDWQGVVVQGLDLTALDEALELESISATTSFIGCTLGSQLAAAAGLAGALMIPTRPGLAFNPFRSEVYVWTDLLNCYDRNNPESYRLCTDWLCYEAAMDETTKKKRAGLGADDELLFRLHDFAQEDALLDFLKPDPADPATWKKVVAIMGGHDLPRLEKNKDANGQPTATDAPYLRAALLAWQLTRAGYLIATGGGPGAMEAGNLGAYFAHQPEEALRAAVRSLERVPKVKPIAEGSPRWNSGEWLAPAVEVITEFTSDATRIPGESIGIPTWFYGHEPPNIFASWIAKYFENSLREEGLLAIAFHGVIFAEGNAGTVQEIFQDACQNYYGTYGTAAPMVLLDSKYWNRNPYGVVEPKHKPVWPLLQQLASERSKEGFPRAILLTDSIEAAVAHIVVLDPSTSPA
jgi:predicted Rossmann-fold nucleotide-binding protein